MSHVQQEQAASGRAGSGSRLRFLPLPGAPDRDFDAVRKRMLLSLFTLVGVPVMVLFGVVNAFRGLYFQTAGLFLVGGFICVAAWYVHAGRRPEVAYRVTVGLGAVVFTYALVYGGAHHSYAVWSFVFPFLSFFLLGRREGLAWVLALYAAAFVIMSGILPFAFVNDYPVEFAARFLVSYAVVLALSYFVESVREVLQQSMEKERAELEYERASLSREVEERGKAESALDRERRQLLSIFESIEEPIYVADPGTYELLYVNEALRRHFGEVSGKPCHLALQGLDEPCSFCTNDALFGQSGLTTYIWQQKNMLNGRNYRCIDKVIHWPDGRTVRCTVATDLSEQLRTEEMLREAHEELREANQRLREDIAERERAQEALRESEQRYRGIFDESVVTIYVFDEAGNFIDSNQAGLDLLGYTRDELLGMNLADVDADSEAALPARAKLLAGNRVVNYEHKLRTRDGEIITVLNNSRPLLDTRGGVVGTQSTLIDITDHKKMEEELFRMRKMDAVSGMAGGIAHDFNNLLNVILGSLEISMNWLPNGHKSAEPLEDARSACLMAGDLVRKFSVFSRQTPPEPMPVSLRRLADEAAAVTFAGTDIEVDFRCGEDVGMVMGDEEQLRHALCEIMKNAGEAMPEGGVVVIECQNLELDEKSGGRGKALRAGTYVCLSVRDGGPGIAEDHLSCIFDPYFSTKQKGSQKGMGLGLTMAYSVMEKHEGRIEVSCASGEGTTVAVLLPVAETPEIQAVEAAGNGQVTGRKILVMDDEGMMRRTAIWLLEILGHQGAGAESGEEAMRMVSEAQAVGEPFDALILDLTVRGGMGGIQCMKTLRRMALHVPAIVATGHPGDPVMTEYSRYGFEAALAKPYTMRQVQRALTNLFKAGGAGRNGGANGRNGV
ncbi:MAG: PAS domain S-box protein [Desulfatibacillaceae bacterium]